MTKAAGAAWRHLHGTEPPKPTRHAKILVSDFLDDNGELRGDTPLGAIVLDECRRRGIKPPRDIIEEFDIFWQRASLESTGWLPGWVTELSKKDPDFRKLWRRVRIPCEWCDGYLVVRRRGDRRYKFAGCSNYVENECRFTIGSRQYANTKGRVVFALFIGTEPEAPYLFR